MTQSKMKTIQCNHIDHDNKYDCQNTAEWMCQCCGVAVCAEHLETLCPFGGEPYYEINYDED